MVTNHNRLVPTNSHEKPHWDATTHTLYWRGKIIKRFRRPAGVLELILTAFEEDGWPERIDDPLPKVEGSDAKQRLHDAIKRLNQSFRTKVIRFCGDGHGEGIFWEANTRA